MASRVKGLWATVLICAVGLALNLWIAANNNDGWGVDFNQFYSASHLAGTGQLYNWDALRQLEAQHGKEVRTGRLPIVSFAEKLVSWMPYDIAHVVWLGLCVAALVAFAFLWPGMNRTMMMTSLCWSMPAALLLILGQDTPFWLMSAALGFWLLERDRPHLAGVAFSLCICKYHLAIGIPILLIAQKRWSTIAAGAAAGAVWIAASFAIEGPSWPQHYLAMITQPLFSPAPERMPNLRGIAFWFPAHAAVEAVLAVAVVILVWSISRTSPGLGAAGAVALSAGLVLAHHGYANDCALMIPLLALAIQRPESPKWLKMWAILLLTPAPTLLLSTNKPFAGQFLLAGFVLVALVMERSFRGSLARVAVPA